MPVVPVTFGLELQGVVGCGIVCCEVVGCRGQLHSCGVVDM